MAVGDSLPLAFVGPPARRLRLRFALEHYIYDVGRLQNGPEEVRGECRPGGLATLYGLYNLASAVFQRIPIAIQRFGRGLGSYSPDWPFVRSDTIGSRRHWPAPFLECPSCRIGLQVTGKRRSFTLADAESAARRLSQRLVSKSSNNTTGANAGGAPRLHPRALRAARIAQFFRSAHSAL